MRDGKLFQRRRVAGKPRPFRIAFAGFPTPHKGWPIFRALSNAFADENDEYGLSVIAKQFIAGQLYHARAMCAVLEPRAAECPGCLDGISPRGST